MYEVVMLFNDVISEIVMMMYLMVNDVIGIR